MLKNQREQINVFISSSRDLRPERTQIKGLFEALNRDPRYRDHYHFETFIYEEKIKEEDLHGMDWQQYINLFGQNLSLTHLVIGMVWSRLGIELKNFTNPITGRNYRSGTEYEIFTAFDAQKYQQLPYILFYQCNRSAVLPDGDLEARHQKNLADEFLRELQDESIVLSPIPTFNDAQDLCHQIQNELARVLPTIEERLHQRKLEISTLPALPADFVQRQSELVRISRGVLENRVFLLHGLPGQGKTVMARALCDSDAINVRFIDGILWATIGQQAGRTPEQRAEYSARIQREWILQLQGQLAKARDATSAHEELLRCVEGKSILIILDDVWRADEVKPLLAELPTSCHIFITTRTTSAFFNAQIWELGPMAKIDSRELIKRASKRRVVEDALCDEVASRLGYLALALKIVGSLLARYSWEEIRQKLQSRQFLDLAAGQRNVYLSLDASVRFLPADQQQRYQELIIFLPGEPLEEAAVARLWQATAQITQEAAHYLLTLFLSVALIQSNRILHDLQVDYLMATTEQEQREQWHESLLTTYGSSDKWGDLPDDDNWYGWRRLTWHVAQIKHIEELRSLLLNASYLQHKILRLKSRSLIDDFALIPDDPDIRLLARAMNLSRAILDEIPADLPNQIQGRCGAKLFGRMHHWPSRPEPHFRLRTETLQQAGGSLLRLMSHKKSINRIIFSPDGHSILSASEDGTLRLWNTQTGERIHAFQGHMDAVTDCAFSLDGQLILSASKDRTLRLWNTQTGELLNVFEGHTDTVIICAFHPDRLHVLSVANDHTLRLWNIQTCELTHLFQGGSSFIISATITSNGHHLFAASKDRTFWLWDIQTGELVYTSSQETDLKTDSYVFSPDRTYVLGVIGHDTDISLWNVQTGEHIHTLPSASVIVTACAFSPDSQYILSAAAGGIFGGIGTGGNEVVMQLWDVQTGECIRTFQEKHGDWVGDLAISSDGRYALSASRDHELFLWNMNTGENVQVFQGHSDEVTKCAFSPDGRYALSTSKDRTVRLWNVQTNQPDSGSGHTYDVYACAFSPDGRYILSASRDYTLRLWSTVTGACVHIFRGHTQLVADCAFSPDGRYALSASYDMTLRLWDTQTGKSICTYSQDKDIAINACAYSPDGRYILSAAGNTATGGSQSDLWDVQTGQRIFTFQNYPAYVYTCAFSPDGRYALTVSIDTRLWNVQTGECVFIFPGANPVALSSDSRYLLTTCENKLWLWDIQIGKHVHTFQGHADAITDCAFSPGVDYALSASKDGTLRLWDVQTGQSRLILSGHDGPVTIGAFTPDGQYVLSAGDTILQLWNIQTGSPVMRWQTDSPITCVAFAHTGLSLALGDSSGSLHLLALEHVPMKQAILSLSTTPAKIKPWLGELEQALDTYEQILRVYPRDANAHQGQAIVLQKLQRYEEALAAFEAFLLLDTNSASTYRNIGDVLTALGRGEEAREAYKRAHELDSQTMSTVDSWRMAVEIPGEKDSHFFNESESSIAQGNAFFAWEKYEDALLAYERAIQSHPDDARLLYNKGVTLEKLGRDEEAQIYYEQALGLEPRNSQMHRHRGAILVKRYCYKEALQAYSEALRLDPNNAGIYRDRGIALYNFGLYREALQAYNNALNFNKEDAATYYNKGDALKILGQIEQAQVAYEQALLLSPDIARTYLNPKAILEDFEGQTGSRLVLKSSPYYDPENDYYNEALKQHILAAIKAGMHSRDDEMREIHKHLDRGLELFKQGLYEEALVAIEQILSIDAKHKGALFAKGVLLYWLKRYEEALAPLEQAISSNRSNPQLLIIAYEEKGSTLAELGRYGEALVALEQAIRLKPDSGSAYDRKGFVLIKLQRYEEALIFFEQAIRLKPDSSGAYGRKGFALIELQRYEEALASFEQAIHLDPQDATAYNNKGVVLRRLRRYEEALTAYKQAIRIDSQDADTYFNQGELFYHLKRFEEALSAYEQAQKLKPDGAIQRYIEDTLKALGKIQEARQAYSNSDTVRRQQKLPDQGDLNVVRAVPQQLKGGVFSKEPGTPTASSFPVQAVSSPAWPCGHGFRPGAQFCPECGQPVVLETPPPSGTGELSDLATLYHNQEKFEEAEAFYRRTLEIREQHWGSRHPMVAQSLNNLAVLYDEQERFLEAEPFYRRALSICQQELGTDDPATLVVRANYRGFLHKVSQAGTQSIDLLHPSTANYFSEFADRSLEEKKYAEAERFYQQALAIREKQLGSQHLDTAQILNNLAVLYENQGRIREAEALYRRALVICEHQIGLQHPVTQVVLNQHLSLLKQIEVQHH